MDDKRFEDDQQERRPADSEKLTGDAGMQEKPASDDTEKGSEEEPMTGDEQIEEKPSAREDDQHQENQD